MDRMRLSPVARTGAFLAAELATIERHGSGGAAYAEALMRHGLLPGTLDPDDALTFPQTVQLAGWARALRPVFGTTSATAAPDRGAAVDALLERAGVRLRLASGPDPRWRFTVEGDAPLAAVQACTAGGLALFVLEAGADRLGECASPRCHELFVDLTRNGSRRHCTPSYGNHQAVRRRRDRLAIEALYSPPCTNSPPTAVATTSMSAISSLGTSRGSSESTAKSAS